MVNKVLAPSKACRKCGVEKPATTEFFPAEGDRLRSKCRPCRAADKRIYRQAETEDQRERRLAGARAYAAANAARVAAIQTEYRRANKVRLSEYQRARYLVRQEEVKARARKWREANLDRKREANRRWAAENKGKAAKSGRESKARRRQDATVRINDAVSASIRFCLKFGKGGRRWETLVGYTVTELAAHLERQFAKGMNWDNYGDWHIDHIVPVAAHHFDSADDPEFRACWALTNLRPMWAADNIRKSNKRLTLL